MSSQGWSHVRNRRFSSNSKVDRSSGSAISRMQRGGLRPGGPQRMLEATRPTPGLLARIRHQTRSPGGDLSQRGSWSREPHRQGRGPQTPPTPPGRPAPSAHMGQGSSVTTSVASLRRQPSRVAAASRRANTSACAVGSPVSSRSLWRAATIRPSITTTAPTGTSPCSSAEWASLSAATIHAPMVPGAGWSGDGRPNSAAFTSASLRPAVAFARKPTAVDELCGSRWRTRHSRGTTRNRWGHPGDCELSG